MGDNGYASMGQRGLGGMTGGKDAVMQVKAAAFGQCLADCRSAQFQGTYRITDISGHGFRSPDQTVQPLFEFGLGPCFTQQQIFIRTKPDKMAVAR